MMTMRSANPVLPENTFSSFGYSRQAVDTMTVQGTVMKTLLLLLVASLSAGWVWMNFYQGGQNAGTVSGWMMIGAIGGLICALVTTFKKEWASITAPLYAALQGLFIGGISAMLEASYPGIVIQATGLTFGTLFMMLFAYQSGIVKATEKFKLGVFAATGGIAMVYFVSMILSLFGVNVSFIYGSGTFSIVFSLFVVAIAALNFVIDFDFIEQGAQRNVPKYMEWYGAFALMVTLIWLYVEFLRLLSKLRER